MLKPLKALGHRLKCAWYAYRWRQQRKVKGWEGSLSELLWLLTYVPCLAQGADEHAFTFLNRYGCIDRLLIRIKRAHESLLLDELITLADDALIPSNNDVLIDYLVTVDRIPVTLQEALTHTVVVVRPFLELLQQKQTSENEKERALYRYYERQTTYLLAELRSFLLTVGRLK